MSTVNFVVPPSWKTVANITELSCQAATVGEAITWFAEQYPTLRERILTTTGRLAPWTLVCLNNIDIHTLQQLDTPLTPVVVEIHLIGALMGG
ncbi:hypothetical protein GFY24_33405 [Nocardia sp. SYP-A9097]|uniref:hypothetical protein n=1 Tax=Nocardia sp. SYP-A9097 TaxID=2663237 RepID=UPI00129C0B85|nr:hypothetical protein [Nocardia sp. SYP-A9097]MRH92276.1 hypothetical protein [Nocardia sp. SYP-A9097]